MIKSKEDLIRYLDCDKNALNITRSKPRLIGDEIWKYEIALRKREYYTNVRCWGGGIYADIGILSIKYGDSYWDSQFTLIQ